VQSASNAGATAIGPAREANHSWPSVNGVIPIRYDGPGPA
jgi:hypothetical protein